MKSLKKWIPVLILGAGYSASGSLAHAEDADLKKIMEEIRAIKAKNAELESKSATLEAKNTNLEKQVNSLKNGNEKKASAEVAVDKALKKSADDGFYHDADLHPRKIKIGGLVDFSYQFNLNNPGERYNSLRGFDNYQSNDFALNLAEVYFDGTAKQKGEAGFMIDLGFGRDVSSMPSLVNTVFVDPPLGVNSGLAYDNILQAYVNYIAPIGNGLELTAGKFLTPIGFETSKGDNWNITRSMNFTFLQPRSHTGGQLAYQVFDNWKVKAAVINSFYNRTAQDNNNSKSYYFSSTWNPTKQLSWTLTGLVGNEDTRQSDASSGNLFENVFTSPNGTNPTGAPYGDFVPPAPGSSNTPGAGLFGFGSSSPISGTHPNLLRNAQNSTTYTVNSKLTYDPLETLHFGFEFNWQMKEGFDYKKDDLITDLGGLVSVNGVNQVSPANGSLNSMIAYWGQTNINNGIAVGSPGTFTTNSGFAQFPLTAAQVYALHQYYDKANRANAYTYGAAAYVKWDFAKKWYVALRGEYINDQDNLNFRNDLGVAAQTTAMQLAKQSYFGHLNYAPVPEGTNLSAPVTPAQFNDIFKKLDHRNNDAWSITSTVGWNITKSLKWKLEYRHDQAAKDVFYKGGAHKTYFTNFQPAFVPGTTPPPVFDSFSHVGTGYLPNTSNSQDTISTQFQYSF